MAFWKFDEKGQVLEYAAWIPNLSVWVEAATGVGFSGVSGWLLGKGTGEFLCPIIQKRCTGKNTQYKPEGWPGTVPCEWHMLKTRFGTFDEAWGNTIACRAIHLILTQVRPEEHCPHLGPKGRKPARQLEVCGYRLFKRVFRRCTTVQGTFGRRVHV